MDFLKLSQDIMNEARSGPLAGVSPQRTEKIIADRIESIVRPLIEEIGWFMQDGNIERLERAYQTAKVKIP